MRRVASLDPGTAGLSRLAPRQPDQPKPGNSFHTSLLKQDERPAFSVPLPPLFEKLNRDIHDQLLHNLQEPDGAVDDQCVQQKETEQERPRVTNGEFKGPSGEVAQMLYGIVDTMLNHLKTKEETIYRSARMYKKGTVGCVEKIGHKYNRERHVLVDTWVKDSAAFARRLQGARDVVTAGSRKSRRLLEQVEEKAAGRRMLYQRAIAGLRALHGHLMDGKLPRDEAT